MSGDTNDSGCDKHRWTFCVHHTEDELLVSVVARLGALNAVHNPRDLMQAVLGRRTGMISLDLPANLKTVVDRMPPSGRLATPEAVLEVATLYPYFRPFANGDRWKSIVDGAVNSSLPGLKLKLGLTCHGFGASMGFRLCHACVSERWRRLGAISWTRACNLPEVVVCPVHRTSLVIGIKQSSMTFRQRIPMPDLRADSDAPEPPNLDVLTRFARLSGQLLSSGRLPLDVQTLLQVYRERMAERGFIRGTEQVRWVELSSFLLEHHGHYEGFPSRRHLTATREGVLGWLPSVLSPRKASHPVVNLLLIDALFDGLDEFFVRLDACSGADVAAASGSKATRRTSASAPKLASDLVTKRDEWTQLHEANPTLSTTQLRPRMSALYAWLHRNDREWMRAHGRGLLETARLKPKPRIDWSQRDVVYASALADLGGRRLSLGSGRPLTTTGLLKMLGPETSLRKHLHQLPKLRAEMANLLARSREEYGARRAARFSKPAAPMR